VKAVVLGHGLAYLTVALIGLYCVRRTVRTIPHSEEKVPFRFREIISHGLPLNVTAIAQRLLRRGDILVLGVLVSESGVGLYRCAYTIASGFRQLLTPINSFAVFRMSKKFGRKQIDAVVRHYGTAVLLSLSLALPAYLISFVFADEIVTLIFGEAFSRSAPILRVLSAGFAVFVAVGPMGALFNTLGKNWVRMWMVLAIGTLNIILNITLINLMGLIGAAFATAFSFGVLYVVFSFFVKSTFLGYKADYRPMGVIVTTTVLVAGIEALLSEPGWAHLAGAIGGALIVMGGGLLMTWRSYRMKPDDQEQAETGLGHDYVAAD
jgi:O-antigen/teichoic acid export membrane protein